MNLKANYLIFLSKFFFQYGGSGISQFAEHSKIPFQIIKDFDYLKKMNNDLEYVAFLRYPKLKIIKSYLENSLDPLFVRMTGSGSAFVAYFQSKKRCDNAQKLFAKKFKNYWSIASKTI